MSVFRATPEWLERYQKKREGDKPQYAVDKTGEVPTLTDAVKPNKFRNKRTGRFASKKEAKRAAELELLLAAGEISDLCHAERNPERLKFLLIPKQPGERACFYIADAVYRDRDGKLHIEDTKSEITKTPVFRLKKKLMLMIHHLTVEMV